MGQSKPKGKAEVRRWGVPGPGGRDGSGPQEPSRRLGAYLRRLREGYGYTLRKVEQRAQAIGESIDNSQLSRFEKGKAVPSFDKLRALAKIFNVSVQNFSDILDLEPYDLEGAGADDYEALLREGSNLFAQGEHGRAFLHYERALEVAECDPSTGTAEHLAEARRRMAAALKALGKLGLTEAELRNILRERRSLGRETQLKVLLELSYVYRQRGDLYLASVLARECLDLAVMEGDLRVQAAVLNTLGGIEHDEGEYAKALDLFTRSLELVERTGDHPKLRVVALTNLGGCLVSVRRFDEGVARLREAYSVARERRYRRVAALAMNRLAEAYHGRADFKTARRYLAESDALASGREETYHDILFMNAFLRWKMAQDEGKPTREAIAFGRLRHYRSLIERKFPEVQEFDLYVERTRRR